MAQISVPSAPKEYATHYTELLGVDFQSDQTQVDRRRSPDMVNMISDFGGNPVKRDGYREVGSNYGAIVQSDGVTYGIYATNSVLTVAQLTMTGYTFVESNLVQYSGNVGEINTAFAYQQNIYIIADKALIRYDTEKGEISLVGVGTNMMSVGAIGSTAPVFPDNIPDTVIGLKPNGTGGTAYDDKNLFSIYQRVNYQGDGSATAYKIPNYKKIGNYVKAEVKDSNGDWQPASVSLGTASHDNSWRIDGSNNLDSCTIVNPTVTFTSPPDAPAVAGEDNVRITFAPYSMEQLKRFGNPTAQSRGYYNEELVNILASGIAAFQNGRMFVADDYKAFYSDVSDPFTVSDLSWFEVDSEIIGFTRSNNYLVILTKGGDKNTIFLANEATRVVDKETGATETYFAVKASNSGINAIAPKCIATLSDEPMFLSNAGIFGLLTNYLSDKYAVNRSSRINRKLCKEPNLESAVGVAFNDYFYLAVNGRMYVLDGRHKESDRAGNKPLEAYYFEGLPAIENMYVIGDRMYFSDDESTYTWNSDLPDTERYIDGKESFCTSVLYGLSTSPTIPPTEWDAEEPTPAEDEYLWYKAEFDDLSTLETTQAISVGDSRLAGDPVCARWCSAYDDDGAPQRLKTLMKKGSMVTLVPHFKSGCEITLAKDGDFFEYLGSFDSDLQTFEYIDFSRFTFSANAVAFDNFTKKKIKKYKRLQIQVENNKAEPFGLTQITKTYIFGNYAKR